MNVIISLLPFKSLSEKKDMKWLVEGFQQDLITNLSRFTGLSIISHEVALSKSVNAELQAEYLISGSFRCFEEQLRIGIQLTNALDAKVIFAHEYKESLDEIFSIQDDVIHQIVNILSQQIDFDLLSSSYKKEQVALKAYENYLMGMAVLKKGGKEHDLTARKYFETALAINPEYARAYTGLSLSYFNEWSCQLWDKWDVSQKGAHKYSLKALELDENDYVALAVAGRTSLYSEEYEKAEHYLRKSIKINPNDANNLIQVAFSMMFLGLTEEAEALYRRACKLNPLHPDAYFGYGSNIYFEMGEYSKSLKLGEKLVAGNYWTDFSFYLAAAYFEMGDIEAMKKNWNIYLNMHAQYILNTSEPDEKAALEWQIKVNPYKCGTRLEGFRNFMKRKTGLFLQPDFSASQPETAFLICKGSLWELHFKNQMAVVKNAKGLHDIKKLLERQEEEIHCTELLGAAIGDEKGIEVMDRQAKINYQNRIQELQEELVEAEAFHHSEKLHALHKEYDQLIDHLSGAVGLSGKTRTTSTSVDKARSAVTLRIKSSMQKIEEVHPLLAKHLHLSIKTGVFCCYSPEVPVHWEF